MDAVKRGRAVLGIVLACLCCSAVLVSSAQAYTHGPWSATRAEYNRNTDPQGPGPWHSMSVTPNSYAYWCASGEDGGGGIRNFVCAWVSGGIAGARCDIGSPDLTAYTYGGGYAGQRWQQGYANTFGGC
jgi:hypothetical protein